MTLWLLLCLANDPVPVLETRCVSCHGPDKQKGGLRLDSRAAVLKGGDTGPAAIPGRPEASLLLQAVDGRHPDLKMPPKETLPADQVEALARWIRDGLLWPERAAVAGPLGDAWSDPRNPIVRLFGGKRLDLWSLRPLSTAPFPGVDALLLAELRKKGLGFSPEADRRALIRRVTFDLTGLPPSREEVEAFARDGNYEALVDRLLASRAYGERWARHWLDVVRYSDTNGFERDEFQKHVWRYRDYVIRSLNADKPFDRFVREQLAGDEMLSGPPRDAEEVDALLATGYLRLGPYDSTGVIFEENAKNRNELMTDLANTTGSAFLAMSMACANCHDHKHDPISQADHFRLRAFFAALQRQDDAAIDLAPLQERRAAVDAEIKALEAKRAAVLDPARKAIVDARRAGFPEEIEHLLALEKPGKEERETLKPWQKQLEVAEADVLASLDPERRRGVEEIAPRVEALRKERPAPVPAMIARDAGRAAPATHLFYQGDFTQPREEVAPGFLSALDPNPAVVAAPKGVDSTGRRSALAAWIASPRNPLTARVIVNRLWLHHFGRGLVATPNDFGFGGARPSHPALLDGLAAELVAGGWRLKGLHRTILLSTAYRQASRERAAGRAADVENLLLWRQNPRRLDGESTRDALLAVTGALRPRDGGPPVWPPVPQDLLDAQPGILEVKSDQGAKDRLQGWFTSAAEELDVRSIYLVQKRALSVPFLQPFDAPDMNVSCGRRDVTTVAPQALQLLNSPFAERMARTFAARPEPLDGLFLRALGRRPSARELEILERLPSRADACRAILNLNEFVYLD